MNPIALLFPHEPFAPQRVDPEFTAEYEAARSVGFPTLFYDHEAVEAGDILAALRRIPPVEGPQRMVLRGWMIPGEAYRVLHDGLAGRGYEPQTAPEAYEEAHYLPFAYGHIEGETARSEWISGDDAEAAWRMYADGFSGGDAIIKDWVKSAKARWREGCFIPAGTGEESFRRIYEVFRQERGRLFNRGVVLREFMPIVERGSDIRGLPLVEETRLFFWRGEILVPPDRRSPSALDERARWEGIARKFASPFITIDVAYLTDGRWKIVEVGDGGVSGLPVGLDPQRFYASLWNRFH